MLVPNFPPSILVQPSYDSREIEQRLASKALQFIRENANKEVLLHIASAIKIKTSGGEEYVMTIWVAGKGLIGFGHMIPHILKTRR